MSASSSPSLQSVRVPTEPTPDPKFSRLATEEEIGRTVASLERNGFKVLIAASREEAVQKVLALIPPGASVLDASSQTLAALGIPEAIAASKEFHGLRADLLRLRQENQPGESRRLGASPDVVVGSVHALTHAGQAVVASATGSQLAPYAFSAGKVIWVVGTQKIVPDLETAFQRIRDYTFPLENERAQKVYGVGSSIAKQLIVNREVQPGRITVVLIRENLGF